MIRRSAVLVCVAAFLVAGCGKSNVIAKADSVTIVAGDNFTLSQTTLDAFTSQTGIKVKVLKEGGGEAALNKVILTRDHPLGDVFYGVDNGSLAKAVNSGVFYSYSSPRLALVTTSDQLDETHQLTPIDQNNVCVTYDKAALAAAALDSPSVITDLTNPIYKNKVETEDPNTDNAGFAFVAASVKKFGENGWQSYWRDLKSNGIGVAPTQSEAAKAGRPIVVGNAPVKAGTNVGVLPDSCLSQVDFAAVMHGTKKLTAAHQLIDFLLSTTVQDALVADMNVFPVVSDASGVSLISNPGALNPDEAGSNRDAWLKDWATATK